MQNQIIIMTHTFKEPNIQDEIMNTNQLTAIRIKEERNRLNYSQQAVADYLKMDISTYSRLENGKIEITIAKLEAIAEFFNVPIVSLLPSPIQNNYLSNGSAIIQGNGTINNNFGDLTNKETLNFIIETLNKLHDKMN